MGRGAAPGVPRGCWEWDIPATPPLPFPSRSKFIPEGSQRVGLRVARRCRGCQLEHTAFLRPDGAVVLVVLNRSVVPIPTPQSDPHPTV